MSLKLESLSAFESKSINQMEMGKIRGGEVALASGAGSTCVPTTVSSTGCLSYTSDVSLPGGGLEYVGSKDIVIPC